MSKDKKSSCCPTDLMHFQKALFEISRYVTFCDPLIEAFANIR